MINLVFLFAAMAIVSLQCEVVCYAEIDNKIEMANSIQPNVVQTPKKTIKNHIHITSTPPETVQHHGSPLLLECQAFGSPAPQVTWLRNGEPVADLEEDSNEIFSPHLTSVAQITSKLVVTQPSNGDVYTCVATAGVKQQSASTTVFTAEDFEEISIEKLFRLPLKPVITATYNDVMQKIGSNLVLPCRVHSLSKYQFEWIDNNNNNVYGNSRMRVLPSGDLLIIGLRWKDMGGYTCSVKNSYGKDMAETFLYPYK